MQELKTDSIKPVVNRSWDKMTTALRAEETSQSLYLPLHDNNVRTFHMRICNEG